MQPALETPFYQSVTQAGYKFSYYTFGEEEGHRHLQAARWFSVQQVHGVKVWQISHKMLQKPSRNEGYYLTKPKEKWKSFSSENCPTKSYDGISFCKSSLQVEDAGGNSSEDTNRIALIIKTADCLPVFLHYSGPLGFFMATLHCGWRSLAGGIIDNALLQIELALGITKTTRKIFRMDVKASFAPAIGSCCYEVGEDLLQGFKVLLQKYGLDEKVHFRSAVGNETKKEKKFFLSIEGLANEILQLEGIESENIVRCGICTKCTAGLFSHRENKDKRRNYNVLLAEPLNT